MLSLKIKGLLLVGLLLLIELVFVGSHAWLLHEAEKESVKQQNAKEVVARATDLLQLLYNAGDNVAKYSFNRDMACLQKYEKATREIPLQIDWIRQHLADDKLQLELLDKIEASIKTGLGSLAEMKEVSDKEAQFVAMRYAVKLRAKVQTNMEVLVHDLIDFLNTEKKIESTSPKVLKAQRDMVKIILLAAIAMNIAGALVLVIFFTRRITSRLNVVEENSLRLRQRKALRAPLSGDDEIALLDQAFHQMSHTLRGEEALVLASEEQVQTIVDQMPIGIAIIRDQTIEYANPTLEQLLGIRAGKLAGSDILSHFTTVGPRPQPFSDLNVEGTVELTAMRNGTTVPVEFSLVDISLGQHQRRLATVIDITEKREVEKMKEAFVAMVSHDLRTPLTSVAGFLHMLPMGVYGQLAQPVIDSTKAAETQVEQLISLINDLLDLEKLRAGQLDMRMTSVDLEDVIDAAVDGVYTAADDQMISLLFEGCQAKVIGDLERLQQAFTRAMEAVIKISRQGETITIVATDNPQEKTVSVFITTEHLDIPPAVLPNLFEPFQPVDLPGGGISLGLGLPLTRAIIAAHGGACGAALAGRNNGSADQAENSHTKAGLSLLIKLPT